MSSRVAIVVFPGSNCEQDVMHALELLDADPYYVWHLEETLGSPDGVVLPGGFAYGDYLRTGAIAAFSPIMGAVKRFASSGGPVIGICNGFQVLCESGLLPGVLRRNSGLKFRCTSVHLRVETADSPFTASLEAGAVLEIPINHFEGNYYCPEGVLQELIQQQRIALRYCEADGAVTARSNPNGALENIAGVLSEGRNVLGLMPHPERASDPALGGVDGQSILRCLSAARVGV